MTDDEKEYCKKCADDILYGPRMSGHAQFRHFALLKVEEIYKAGKRAGKEKRDATPAA